VSWISPIAAEPNGGTIGAGRFKVQCVDLLAEVAATGETIVVTRRRKPVAKIEPVEEPPSLRGSVWDVERE